MAKSPTQKPTRKAARPPKPKGGGAAGAQARKDKQALKRLTALVKSPHLDEVDIAKVLDECSAILAYRLEKAAFIAAEGRALALPGECWELSGAAGDPNDPDTPVTVKRNGFKVRDSTIGQVL